MIRGNSSSQPLRDGDIDPDGLLSSSPYKSKVAGTTRQQGVTQECATRTMAMLDSRGTKRTTSMTTSIDDTLSEIRWLRNEIWRRRRLLKSGLAGAARVATEKRLIEQLSAFERLLSIALPLILSPKVHFPKCTEIE
ncbi:hypothetical protein [Bradyrhizobium sp. SBR1B]|uniref:hypothetical protein n=1 Tax=Bradyrhizobium sp. SBR1B TaxID=2663836 RepID=UPI001FEFE4AB|nr:hypothetical protein [Bradyrhizobium sp. SBR1B]